MTPKHTLIRCLCALCLVQTLAACSDSQLYEADTELNVPTRPLQFRAAAYCQIDSDCETGRFCFQSVCTTECTQDDQCSEGSICSEHGRCVDVTAINAVEQQLQSDPSFALDNETVATTPTQFPNVAAVEVPPSIVEIEPLAATVDVRIVTDRDVPGGAILYRIERGDDGSISDTLRAEGTRTFTLTLPTGSAGEDPSAPQFLTVTTSVGTFQIAVRQQVPTSGRYQGHAQLDQFGGGRLPIEFGLELNPAQATLDDATSGRLFLRVAPTEVFSPHYADPNAAPYWLGTDLEYDSGLGIWYASFAAPFALPTDRIFSGSETIQRALRIELWHLENGVINGAISDRWQGIFAERNEEGVTTLANVVIDGEFSVQRNQGLREIATEAQAHTPAITAPPLPQYQPITACSADTLSELRNAVAANYTNTDDSPCVGMTSVEAFYVLPSEERAACAVEAGEIALSGPTIARQIRAFMDANQDNPGDISFAEFLTRCANQDGFCEPNPKVECARELSAYAYQAFNFNESASAAEANALNGVLLESFQSLLSEGFLGRQLAAYQQDTQTRLAWLRTSIVPLFLAADLRTYNEDILRTWETLVLDTHYEVLGSQLSTSTLEVLARTPTDPSAIAVRETLLLELAQSWQSTMEAVNLAATRWNELYQNDMHRRTAAASVQRRMFELYVSAGVLAHLNYASGTGAFNSTFGPGFASIARSLQDLSASFNDLIFMRDAEVVLSTSVSPESSSNTVLRDRETLARQAIADAQDSVNRVLAEASNTELRNELIRNQLVTQLEALRAELISYCGVPVGCHSSEIGVAPACSVRTEIGECGLNVAMSIDPASVDEATLLSAASASQAGQHALDILSEMQELQATRSEYVAHVETIRIKIENARAFELALDGWRRDRERTNAEVDAILEDINRINSAELDATRETFEKIQQQRKEAHAAQAKAVEAWNELNIDEATGDFETLSQVNTYNMRARNLATSAELAYSIGDAIAEGIPEGVTSISGMFTLKTLILGAAVATATPFMYSSAAMETRAETYEAELDLSRELRAAQVENLRDIADLNAQLSANALEKLSEDLRTLELSTDNERRVRESLIDALRRSMESDQAYERDLQELRDRQAAIKGLVAETPMLLAQVSRGEINLLEKTMQYERSALAAQLIEGRFNALNARMNNIEQLIGSPSVIFSFANRLASAEARLERSKGLLFDWLVALEYYAVRPFVDQRLAILLARNPQQLEAIANHLLELQRRCGGIVNQEHAVVSVRDDLLGMKRDVFAGESDTQVLTPAQRFRALLRRASIPIDTRVRYSTDENIGDVITSRSVFAASFPIRLTDFANLPQTCNAKIASIGVELVGEGLPANLRPTVSVLYDGTSELRSCQANIDQVVAALDPGTTNFGKITRFRTQGRSVTPVARVNGFADLANDNRGLEGLPLSSTYTLLIDPTIGDNRFVDWTQLEDIRLRIGYAYQDVFTSGECQ